MFIIIALNFTKVNKKTPLTISRGIFYGGERGISAKASSACLFWQKQAFPEPHGASPNPRLRHYHGAHEFKSPSAKQNDPCRVAVLGGEREIRTPGGFYPTPLFESGTFNRSDISPCDCYLIITSFYRDAMTVQVVVLPRYYRKCVQLTVGGMLRSCCSQKYTCLAESVY